MIITQDGEGKAVPGDLATYGETQQTLAMIKFVALGERDIVARRVLPAR